METLDARKLEALHLILIGESYAAISRKINVSSKTIRRWAEEPAFAAQLKAESEAIGNILRAQTAALYGRNVEEGFEASKFVKNVMKSDGVPLPVRMRAAGQLMNHSLKSAAQVFKMDQAERKGVRDQESKASDQESQASEQPEAQAQAVETVVPLAQPPGCLGGLASENSKPVRALAKAQTAAPEPVAPAPNVPTVPNIPPVTGEDPVPALVQVAILLQKADISGQKRTSEAEYCARRQRLEQIDREQAGQAPEKLPHLLSKAA